MQLQFIRSQQRLYTMDDRGLVINNYDCRSAFVPGYNESGQPRESLPNGKYWCKAEIGDFGAPYGTFISQRTITGRVIYTAAAAGSPILMLHIKAGYLPLVVYACKMPMESKCLIGSLRTEIIYC